MAMQNNTISIITSWAKEKLQSVDAGHDWWHIKRVLSNARKIHALEGGSWMVIELAVLLHDVPDPKFFDEEKMLVEVEKKLQSEGVDFQTSEHVMHIIKHLSFSKQWSGKSFDSHEFRIVQDADRLDAIGAIGIARAFSYGGHKGRDFYNPMQDVRSYNNAEDYRSSDAPTINHFYEKLLLLKDMMKTKSGMVMAEQRHAYMEGFLKQFFRELGE